MVLSKTNKPSAGLAIVLRCVVVILGIKIPELVELMSNLDEALGVVVPIPTCANKMLNDNSVVTDSRMNFLFIKLLMLMVTCFCFYSNDFVRHCSLPVIAIDCIILPGID